MCVLVIDDDDDDDDDEMRYVLIFSIRFVSFLRWLFFFHLFPSFLFSPSLFLLVLTSLASLFFAHFSVFDPSVCSRSAVRDSFVSSISRFLTIINDDDPAGKKEEQYPSRELAHG